MFSLPLGVDLILFIASSRVNYYELKLKAPVGIPGFYNKSPALWPGSRQWFFVVATGSKFNIT